MKQYTTPDQTAKLIELGFVPKVEIKEVRVVHSKVKIDHDCYFAIGELLSFLPLSFNNYDYYALTIRASKVMYCDPYLDWIEVEWIKHEELIDNLFDACVNLKEEGVI